MTPARVLHFARRIVACMHFTHEREGDCSTCENMARAIVPVLSEAIVEMAEDHLASVLAVGSKVGSAS